MRTPKFEEILGGSLAICSLVVVSYVVIFSGNDQALGSLIAVVAAATGYYLRGRVESNKP